MRLTARKLFDKKYAFIAPAVIVLCGSFAFAAGQENSIQVQKNDGTRETYRLLPVHYDPQHAAAVSARLATRAAKPADVPDSFQIDHSLLPPVRNQGSRGTCAYFATVGIIEASYIHQDPTLQSTINVSEECLVDVRNWEFDQGTAYTGDDMPGARPDPNGDLPNSIVKTVSEYGVPASQAFSNGVSCVYDGSNTQGTDLSLAQYQQTFTEGSEAYGKGMSFDVNTAPTIDVLKQLISSGTPVEIGLVVYNEYQLTSHWSYNSLLDQKWNVAGGHAVILTGYEVQGSKTVFTFKNSWGDTWGNAGFGTMDDNVLTHSWGYDPSFDFIVSVQ